ncbi:MAG TPA: FAD-dependent oxidoreductase [Gemmatimonadaceae bacterium]|nr:FAD-dependent oxidoreductase [Gemmatimonadaceae bacterium]
MTLQRRDFIKIAGAGAGAVLTGCAPAFLRSGRSSANVIVVGAGAWGGWTALNLRRMGARVTLVDMLGPGNSRSTSGDETRGVRSSYGDRPQGELWMQWARVAMDRWKQWDAEYAKPLKMRVFFTTGDVILRAEDEPFTKTTRLWWEKNRIPHEVLPVDEVRKRWPQFNVDDTTVVLYEPDAGVVRARRATEAVAEVFRYEGGSLVIGRVVPPMPAGFDGHTLRLTNGDTVSGDAIVFAVGPWLGKTFALMQNRMRTPLGRVFYYGTPFGDQRFNYPNMPSWNYPGVTGWPGLPVDNRGFRVRGGESAPLRNATAAGGSSAPPAPTPAAQNDPDLSVRWISGDRVERSKAWVAEHFPDLADAPLLETRSCHYELSSSRNFIVDRHPELANTWIAGGGNAEGFKFGPVIGEYIAKRVLEAPTDPAVAKQFTIPTTEFAPQPA